MSKNTLSILRRCLPAFVFALNGTFGAAAPAHTAEKPLPLDAPTPEPVNFRPAAPAPAKPLAQTPAGWLDDYQEALRRAKAENKLVMVNFTGSDWCGLCQALFNQVFSKPEFIRWADANVIRLYIDMPRLKSLPLERETQNRNLMGKFNIQGVPQVFFLESNGEALTSVGYMPGDAATWIRNVSMLLPKRLIVESSLGAVYSANAARPRPILILAKIGDFSPEINAYTQAVLARPEIVNNSGDNLAVVSLDITKLDTASLSWWRNLAARNRLGQKYPLTALFDSAWQPLYIAQGMEQPASTVANAVFRKLPLTAEARNYSGQWLTDYSAAQKIARARNRPLLVAFTGSDWEPNSAKLQKELFDQPEFKTFAAQNLVLANIDYPKDQPQDAPIKQQNNVLRQAFGLASLPLAIIMRPDGMPLSAFRHTGAPAAEYIKMIQNAIR